MTKPAPTPAHPSGVRLAATCSLTLLVAALVLGAEGDTVDFKIITPNGHIAFTVGASWRVLAMQSHLPVAVSAFQVPNPADANTPESTNLVVSIIDPTSPKGRGALAGVGQQCSDAKPSLWKLGEWSIVGQDTCRAETPVVYSIRDAQRTMGDVVVTVRLAWPHLTSNANDYDREMERLLQALLSSVQKGSGPYSPQPGEVVRRPRQ